MHDLLFNVFAAFTDTFDSFLLLLRAARDTDEREAGNVQSGWLPKQVQVATLVGDLNVISQYLIRGLGSTSAERLASPGAFPPTHSTNDRRQRRALRCMR
jgi:hypothetical protein